MLLYLLKGYKRGVQDSCFNIDYASGLKRLNLPTESRPAYYKYRMDEFYKDFIESYRSCLIPIKTEDI